MIIQPLDRDKLRAEFASAQPFRHICIDDFLAPDFATELAASYPDHATAEQMGFAFQAVNEARKVQVTEYQKFPEPAKRLSDALAGGDFLKDLSEITGIDDLLWDETFAGGGLHITASSGHLDVHVDFNRLEERDWHRRLNLLIYLNPIWEDDWGGFVELWDREVKHCHHSLKPILNRCVIFETSNISFHGVTAVTCPPDFVRKSFASYFYTQEAPAHYRGVDHSTIFKARPDEHLKRMLLMPAEHAKRRVKGGIGLAKRAAKKILG